MSDNFKKIDVPLDWVQIDNIIIGMRILNRANLINKDFVEELIEHLQKFSMKAKEENRK